VIKVATHPLAPKDEVTFFLFENGHRRTLGSGRTNASGTVTVLFGHVKPGHAKVQAKTAATQTLRTGHSAKKSVRVKG
jgi:hypothetical protein